MANALCGRSLLAWHLLSFCSAALGMLGGLDAAGPHNLLCYKKSCTTLWVICQWKAGNASKANYTLHFQCVYQDSSMNQIFQVGEDTSFSFNENTVHVLYNVTIWVENHTEGSLLVSEKLLLQISEAVKLDAPAQKIDTFRVNGTLTLKWPTPSCECHPIQKEARMRHNNKDANWTLVSCQLRPEAWIWSKLKSPSKYRKEVWPLGKGNCFARKEENDDIAWCHVERNVPYEVQIRHRTSCWSSLWSDWSESLVVPAEIRESPKVTHTVGQLGSDGLRSVNLEWEKPSWEQGEVTYTLKFVLLPCNCTTEVKCFLNSYQSNLSGAGYYISLQASNRGSRAPPSVFHLPPAEQYSGLPSLNSSLSGKHLSVNWVVKREIKAYCFEEQPLGETLQGKPCIEEFHFDTDVVTSTGTLEPNRCYHLAVHALDAETDLWSTFAFTHLFSQNTSLKEPIDVRVTNKTTDSAIVHWKPPETLSACPHALKKFIICCRNEQAGSVTSYYKANASETYYRIRGLQAKTTYWVGVWASTGEADDEACQPLQPFVTRLPDPKRVTSALPFWYLGIFGGLLTATSFFCFGKKRVKKVLCSALPDPANTEAVKVTRITEAAQVWLKQALIEPLDSSSPTEPFLVEPPSEEEPSCTAKMESTGCARQVEEFLPPKGNPGCSATVLPLEYNSQGFLNPMDEDDQGQGGWGDLTGVSSEARAGCRLLSPSEVKVGDGMVPPGAFVPLSLTLLETVVVTRNSVGEGSFSAST